MHINDAANFFISMLDQPKSGNFITSIHLQNILYIAQCMHLGRTGKPLFDEDIAKIPVGVQMYVIQGRFVLKGEAPIVYQKHFTTTSTPTERETLELTFAEFGKFNSLWVSQMIREDQPWLQSEMGFDIPQDKMRGHWKQKFTWNKDGSYEFKY